MLLKRIILESDDFQLYFGLPYIPKPHTKSQFAHIFTPEFSKKILTKLLRFLKSASLSLHDAQTVQRQKQVFDQLTRKSRKQESEIRKLEGRFTTSVKPIRFLRVGSLDEKKLETINFCRN